MSTLVIKNAIIVDEGDEFLGSVVVENGQIKEVIKGDYSFSDENADVKINKVVEINNNLNLKSFKIIKRGII